MSLHQAQQSDMERVEVVQDPDEYEFLVHPGAGAGEDLRAILDGVRLPKLAHADRDWISQVFMHAPADGGTITQKTLAYLTALIEHRRDQVRT